MSLDSAKKLRIMLVDDHRIVRQGIAQIINEEPDMEVCCEAGDSGEAFNMIPTCQPGLIIADISLPGMSGIEFLKYLKVEHPSVKTIVLSMHDEALYAERALRAGALAYVMKKESSDEMLKAIRKARSGQLHISEKVGGGIFHKFLGTKTTADSPISHLTDRELKVF